MHTSNVFLLLANLVKQRRERPAKCCARGIRIRDLQIKCITINRLSHAGYFRSNLKSKYSKSTLAAKKMSVKKLTKV